MKRDNGPQIVTQNILGTVRKLFDNHKTAVRRMNDQKREKAGIRPDKAQAEFINQCVKLRQQIIKLLKETEVNDKVRKEKKASYMEKLNEMNRALENIQKRKVLNIKVNGFVAKLPLETIQIATKLSQIQTNYMKNAGMFACGGNDYKGIFQVMFNNLTQRCYMLGNILTLQSKVADSHVVQYQAVQFDQRQFGNLQQQIERVWPSPVIIQKQNKITAPLVQKEIVTQVQHIKQKDRLREAHEMLFGFTKPQDVGAALRIYEEEAGKGDTNAMNSLGTVYEEGRLVPKNLKKAISFFLKSAEQNSPEGLYKVGQFLEKGLVKTKELFSGLYHNRESEVRGAIGYLEKAAKEGHLDAITDLGYIYQKGIRNEQQPQKFYIQPHLQFAQKYYLKAKKQNFPRSFNNLGVFYLTNPNFGEVVQGDNIRRAIKYLQRAVQWGYLKAYLNLGKCYQNAQGVQKNMDKARSLYQQGSKKGDTDCKLAYILTIIRSELSDDRRMCQAADMLREIIAIDSNNNQAKFYLGVFCEKGIGVTKDDQAAFRYIEAAAKNGYPPAINKLGDFYFSGYGCKRDPETAFMFYEKAASEGYLQSFVNMGILYEEGYVPSGPSMDKAIECYQQAASGGNPNGYMNLGLLTWNRNLKEDAEAFLKKAAQMGNIYALQALNRAEKPPIYTSTLRNLQKQNMAMNTRHSSVGAATHMSKAKSFRKSQAYSSYKGQDRAD